MRISHLSINLCLGYQSSHGIYNHDINGARTNHSLCNLQCLLSIIGLRNIQIIYIYTNILCIYGIQGMLRINKAGNSSPLLYLRNHMEGNRRLTARLRSIDLNHSPLRYSAQSQRNIQAERPCRNCLYIHILARVPKLHNRALPIRLLYLCNGGI